MIAMEFNPMVVASMEGDVLVPMMLKAIKKSVKRTLKSLPFISHVSAPIAK